MIPSTRLSLNKQVSNHRAGFVEFLHVQLSNWLLLVLYFLLLVWPTVVLLLHVLLLLEHLVADVPTRFLL